MADGAGPAGVSVSRELIGNGARAWLLDRGCTGIECHAQRLNRGQTDAGESRLFPHSIAGFEGYDQELVRAPRLRRYCTPLSSTLVIREDPGRWDTSRFDAATARRPRPRRMTARPRVRWGFHWGWRAPELLGNCAPRQGVTSLAEQPSHDAAEDRVRAVHPGCGCPGRHARARRVSRRLGSQRCTGLLRHDHNLANAADHDHPAPHDCPADHHDRSRCVAGPIARYVGYPIARPSASYPMRKRRGGAHRRR
jgi:hypothetical protein